MAKRKEPAVACVVCGALAKYLQKWPRCDDHRKFLYNPKCKTCGENFYTQSPGTTRHPNGTCQPPVVEVNENGEKKIDPKRLLKEIRRKPQSLFELAKGLKVGAEVIDEAVRKLRSQHYLIEAGQEDGRLYLLTRPSFSRSFHHVQVEDLYNGRSYKIGGISDTHLCSTKERLDVLNTAYDVFQREGIKRVYHGGNILEGEFKHNKNEIHQYGFENQIAYTVENYPQREGIITEFITGDDHEGWYTQREGINVGKRLVQSAQERGRSDLVFLGHVEADIKLATEKGSSVMRVIHAGMGTAYATSYTQQKIVESYQGGEKPHILLIGHYHKAEMGYPREVITVQLGCTQDQTTFLRKKRIQVHVGFWTFEIHQAITGEVNRFRAEWFPFYDLGFYQKKFDLK